MSAPAILSAALAVALAILAVTRKSAIRAVTLTAGSFLALAACFFTLGAAFAGALQIVIYVGAIVVIFVFAVTARDADETQRPSTWLVPTLVAAGLVVPFLSGLGLTPEPARPIPAEEVGALLFGPWAVAVELASFLLLAAVFGVRHIGRAAGRGR